MLHYVPQHVSSSTLLILRRNNCIITASGIVTLCKQPYSMRVESGLSPLSTRILYGSLQRVTIPEAVVITTGPPHDEQRAARNMLRSVV